MTNTSLLSRPQDASRSPGPLPAPPAGPVPQVRTWTAALRYGAAIVSVGIALLLRLALDPYLGDRSALDIFLAAVAVTAWFGGAGPSVLAILLSLVGGLWFFVSPRGTLVITDVVDLLETGSFVFAGSAIAYLSCSMKRARKAAEESAEEARRRQVDLAVEVQMRERISRELAALNERLEERVGERTLDLRRALQELEAYAYSIAHNLRAPLRAAAGLSEILIEEEGGKLSPEGRQNLTRVIEATFRMDELILGLLEYSRVSRQDFPPARVPLAEAIDEALRRERGPLAARNADVVVVQPMPAILGHRDLVVQVLSQLLSNGTKFTAPGVSPRLRIRAEQSGKTVRLWVEDNGIGIDPRFHERVFGVFERLHRQEEYAGTGIGLAIVRRCMERMGGRSGVESELEKGSRFWIEAPIAAP